MVPHCQFSQKGLGAPETKHLNILSNAFSLYQPQDPSGVFVFLFNKPPLVKCCNCCGAGSRCNTIVLLCGFISR